MYCQSATSYILRAHLQSRSILARTHTHTLLIEARLHYSIVSLAKMIIYIIYSCLQFGALVLNGSVDRIERIVSYFGGFSLHGYFF